MRAVSACWSTTAARASSSAVSKASASRAVTAATAATSSARTFTTTLTATFTGASSEPTTAAGLSEQHGPGLLQSMRSQQWRVLVVWCGRSLLPI